MRKLIVMLAILLPCWSMAVENKDVKEFSQKEIKETEPDIFDKIISFIFDREEGETVIEFVETDKEAIDNTSENQEDKGFFSRIWDKIANAINIVLTVVICVVVVVVSICIIANL